MIKEGYDKKSEYELNRINPKERMRSSNKQTNKRNLSRDIVAMKKVLQMLRQGAITWIGEIGRKY